MPAYWYCSASPPLVPWSALLPSTAKPPAGTMTSDAMTCVSVPPALIPELIVQFLRLIAERLVLKTSNHSPPGVLSSTLPGLPISSVMTIGGGGGGVFTVNDAVPGTPLAAVAVTVTGPPAETPVARPVALTVAIAGFDVVHVNVVVVVLPPASFPVAVNWAVWPTFTEVEDGATTTEATGAGPPPPLQLWVALALLRGATAPAAKSVASVPL